MDSMARIKRPEEYQTGMITRPHHFALIDVGRISWAKQQKQQIPETRWFSTELWPCFPFS